MKKFIIALAAISFVFSFAMATDSNVSHNNFMPEKERVLLEQRQAPDWTIIEKALPENAEFYGVLDKVPVNVVPNTPDPDVILQGGDTVNDATVISSLDYNDNGTTAGYNNNYDEVCPYSNSQSPDVVYSYTADADVTVDIDLYGSDYDTKLYVYENQVTPGAPFACNDDYYSDYTSALFGLNLTSGNTYYIVIDGYGGESGNYVMAVTAGEPPPDMCPEGTVFGQDLALPTDSWSAGTSDTGPAEDYLIYENFSIDAGSITGIRFWGLDAYFSGGWSECVEDPMTFDITFYADNGGQPGNEVTSFTVSIDAIPTEHVYSGFILNEYNATFEPAVELLNGWVSVQGVSDPSTCWFLWMSAITGMDGESYQWDGSALVPTGYDRSICLVGGGGAPGDGETCDSPYMIDAIPYTDSGNSCDYSNDCDILYSDNSDIIYELVIDETVSLVASLVGSSYDTKIAVYQTDCCTGEGSEFLYNDDYEGLQSQVEGVFAPGTYYVVVDGFSSSCGNYILNIYESEPPPPPSCEQTVYGPNDDWNFFTSDVEVGPYVVFDDFSCPDLSEVCAIRFWGLDLYWNSGWSECSENPTQMDITFYEDAAGSPGSVICSYSLQPEVTYTGIYYGSVYELVEYYATFECCQINSGWVSIQGSLNNGQSCVFLWGASPDGNGIAFQDQNGTMVELEWDLSMEVLGPQVGIDETELLPAQFDMLANYPNPFNATTKIAFSLKNAGNVSIDIYDVLGRRVDRLEMGQLDNAQIHTVDYNAGHLATGVYFYNLMVDGEKRATERFSLLK